MTWLQWFGIVALAAFAMACVVAFFRGAKLPPSVFDPDKTPPPMPREEDNP